MSIFNSLKAAKGAVVKEYDCKALFEITVEYKGGSYLLIYGKHINGYFCCLPMLGLSCEMSNPHDTFYNAGKLISVCRIDKSCAKLIAEVIECYFMDKEEL